MQKIKNSIITDMIAAHLTSKEIDFLLYISRFQNELGQVIGVHYKDVCEKMGMSYQGFYDVKNSLVEKGFIRCEKNNYFDLDITILNNAFKDDADFHAGYINTHHNIFYNKKFRGLKAGAKLLALEIMRLSYAGKGQCRIGTAKFYEKYVNIFGVTKRVMRTYLMQLKEFFSIGIKNGIYYMRPKAEVCGKPARVSENDNLDTHAVEVLYKRNRIKDMSEKKISDICTLIRQYRPAAKEIEKDIIEVIRKAIENSLEIINEGENKIVKRKLYPKLVHKLVREELKLA